MQGLSKMADLMILNLITLVCCIPVVTVGASFTALHYMCLKIVRDEETYVFKGYFKSFKENFKQATVIWLLQLVMILVLAGDFYIMLQTEKGFPFLIQVMIFVVAVIAIMTSTFVYPMLAKFDNTIARTIKNSLFVSILQFPKTLLMVAFNVLPFVAVVVAPALFPIGILFCFSLPAFLGALLYNKYFKKLEIRLTGEEEAPTAGEADIFTEDQRESIEALGYSLKNEEEKEEESVMDNN